MLATYVAERRLPRLLTSVVVTAPGATEGFGSVTAACLASLPPELGLYEEIAFD